MDARISGFISTAVCLAFGSVTASVDYTYENDGKTLVATVPDAVATLTTSAEEQTCQLLRRDRSVMTKHVRDVFGEGECDEPAPPKKTARTLWLI